MRGKGKEFQEEYEEMKIRRIRREWRMDGGHSGATHRTPQSSKCKEDKGREKKEEEVGSMREDILGMAWLQRRKLPMR